MLYIYQNQMCNVKWSDQFSSMFTVSNGVRQGAVSSAILFAVYIDELLNVLRQAKIGCHIDGLFYGALVFAGAANFYSIGEVKWKSIYGVFLDAWWHRLKLKSFKSIDDFFCSPLSPFLRRSYLIC